MTLKLNIRVDSRVSERLKTQNLEILKCLRLMGKYLAYYAKFQKSAAIYVLQNCQRSAVRHFIEKPMLLNIVDLSKPKVVLLLNFFCYDQSLISGKETGH